MNNTVENEFALDFSEVNTSTDIIVNSAIDADALAKMVQNLSNVIISDKQKCKIISQILSKIGYYKDSPQMKLQKIVNASILELFLDSLFKKLGLRATRLSKGLYNGTKESGTDFVIADIFPDRRLLKLEAKIYGSVSSMKNYCKNNPETFHEAHLACCYILSDSANHWHWLRRDKNGNYVELGRLPKFITTEKLPSLTTSVCDAGSSTEPWKIRLY